jgi:hypothetical protein
MNLKVLSSRELLNSIHLIESEHLITSIKQETALKQVAWPVDYPAMLKEAEERGLCL